MSLFNTIRSLFGFKAEVEESQQPIDQLDDITSQLSDKKSELVKAQQQFDEINSELTLKLKACDKLIEKGVKEGEFNKNVIQQRLDRITDEFLTNIQTLSKQVSELEQQKVQVEGDILAKAIDLTSRLTKAEQQEINDIIVTWKETGLIKGQEIKSHTRAIVTALDEIVKGGLGSRGGEIIGYTKSGKPIYKDKKAKEYKRFTTDDHYDAMIEHGRRAKLPDSGTYSEDRVAEYDHHSKVSSSHQKHVSFEDAKKIAKKRNDGLNKGDEDIKKSHEPLAIELAGKGDVIYDSPVEGHYANAIVCKYIKGEKYILFLKRAADKVVEPGKWCLPGGHIDEGETIEQAAARELKEEANLDSTGGYVRGKAKCDDGKWAFYVEISPDSHSLALLDGESQNATWMCREEWIEADLIFDLKDHLVAMESRSVNIKDIPDIMNPDTLKKSDDDDEVEMDINEFMEEHKRLLDVLENGTDEERKQEAKRQRKEMGKYLKKSEEDNLEKSIDINNPFYYDSEDDLIKGRAAAEGEERTWGGKKYKKQGGKWIPVGSGKKGGSEKVNVEDHFHEGYNYTNRKLKGYDVGKKSKQWSEHHEAGSRAAEEHHKRDLSDMPASAFEKYQEQLQSKKQSASTSKLSTKQLKEHVENTSTDQLKKVAENKDHPHNDAAKRELERREKDKEGDKPKHNTGYKSLDKALDSVKKKIPSLDIINKHRGIVEDEDDDGGNPKFTKEGYEQLWNDYVEEYSDGWADGDRGKPTAGDFFDFVDGATKSEYFEKQK